MKQLLENVIRRRMTACSHRCLVVKVVAHILHMALCDQTFKSMRVIILR